MAALINPFSVVLAFALALIALGFWKPQIARIILGVFFLVMALGGNLPLLFSAPELYVEAGRNALLPLYRWFFTMVLAWNPPVFIAPLILFETATGGLILSKGKWNKLGLLLGTAFCLLITPVGIEEITAPVLGLAVGLLLRVDFERSLPEMIWKRV